MPRWVVANQASDDEDESSEEEEDGNGDPELDEDEDEEEDENEDVKEQIEAVGADEDVTGEPKAKRQKISVQLGQGKLRCHVSLQRCQFSPLPFWEYFRGYE